MPTYNVKLTTLQFRITSASNGKVNFDMDVHKDHTVRLAHPLSSIIGTEKLIIRAEPPANNPRWHTGQPRRPRRFPGCRVHRPLGHRRINRSEQYARRQHPAIEQLKLNFLFPVTYLSPGGRVGDLLKGTATCDKSKRRRCQMAQLLVALQTDVFRSWQDACIYFGGVLQQQGPIGRSWQPYKVRHCIIHALQTDY